jgi:osmotically-inducible protein OsmY
MTNEDATHNLSGYIPSNDRIEMAIHAGLERSGHCGLRRVTVRVANDRIVLMGSVSSFYLKQLAQEEARRACPQRRVCNEIEVIQSA